MEIRELEGGKLSLTNNGELQCVFIGTGSAFTKKQFQTNLLIIKGNDHLLIDCGTKCSQAMFEMGLNVSAIGNLLITHSHADHIGGLEEVALMGRYMTKRKPNLVATEAYQHILWDMSLRGGCAFNEEKCGDILSIKDFFTIINPEPLKDFPRETFSVKIGSIDITMYRTMHIPDISNSWNNSFWSCGIIIDNRIMFTSDTRFDPELIVGYDERFNFETIFHDCQFFTGGVHASLDELKTLPEHIKRKTYLVHYGDNWEDMTGKVEQEGFAGFGKPRVAYTF
jgi:hypothetical protein